MKPTGYILTLCLAYYYARTYGTSGIDILKEVLEDKNYVFDENHKSFADKGLEEYEEPDADWDRA